MTLIDDKHENLVAILDDFGIWEFKKISKLTGGHINDTYKIESEKSWILQKINNHVFKHPEIIFRNLSEIQKCFSGYKMIPAQEEFFQYQKSKNGNLYSIDKEGEYWRINPFLAGTISIDEITDTVDPFHIGQSLGLFLKKLNTCEQELIEPSIPEFHNVDSRIVQLEKAIKTDKFNRVNDCSDLIYEIYKLIDIYDGFKKEINKLKPKKRIIHGDPKIQNILLNEKTNSIAAIIDPDTIMPGYLFQDFGDMVRSMCACKPEDHKKIEEVFIHAERFKEIKMGFLDGLKDLISKNEIDTLDCGPFIIIFSQTIRFLEDYFSGDRYYTKIAYENQNLDRAKNQYKLLISYLELL